MPKVQLQRTYRPTRQNQPSTYWRKEEIDALAQHLADGLTHKDIGLRMGRTTGAITAKVEHLGWHTKAWNRWADEEIERLRQLAVSAESIKDIADALGRKYSQVALKMSSLGIGLVKSKRKRHASGRPISEVRMEELAKSAESSKFREAFDEFASQCYDELCKIAAIRLDRQLNIPNTKGMFLEQSRDTLQDCFLALWSKWQVYNVESPSHFKRLVTGFIRTEIMRLWRFEPRRRIEGWDGFSVFALPGTNGTCRDAEEPVSDYSEVDAVIISESVRNHLLSHMVSWRVEICVAALVDRMEPEEIAEAAKADIRLVKRVIELGKIILAREMFDSEYEPEYQVA